MVAILYDMCETQNTFKPFTLQVAPPQQQQYMQQMAHYQAQQQAAAAAAKQQQNGPVNGAADTGLPTFSQVWMAQRFSFFL
jgi:hypothetical protein